jgi:Tfp pilus assembly protein PilO
MKAVEQTKSTQRLAISRASVEKVQMPTFKERLLNLQRTVADYEANIPAQMDLGVFLQQMADLMSKLHLREQVVVPGKQIEIKKLNCIPVSVQCKGKLAQIFEFYKSMQGLDRLIRIEQIRLVNDSDFSGDVSMQTELVIYYRPQIVQG